MASWPLEFSGAVVMLHYAKIFNLNNSILQNSVVLGDLKDLQFFTMYWSKVSFLIAFALLITCLITLIGRVQIFKIRATLALMGLLVWGLLTYSCWIADVKFDIYELYLFFAVCQFYVILLLHARSRSTAKTLLEEIRETRRGDKK